jgi:hypothetical protein
VYPLAELAFDSRDLISGHKGVPCLAAFFYWSAKASRSGAGVAAILLVPIVATC